jgi:hypothetical protein
VGPQDRLIHEVSNFAIVTAFIDVGVHLKHALGRIQVVERRAEQRVIVCATRQQLALEACADSIV